MFSTGDVIQIIVIVAAVVGTFIGMKKDLKYVKNQLETNSVEREALKLYIETKLTELQTSLEERIKKLENRVDGHDNILNLYEKKKEEGVTNE